jgi:hypothetical protein
MILTKDELLASLDNEAQLWLHLISKAGPEQQNYRPSPEQRSTLELVRYMSILGPHNMRWLLEDKIDLEHWIGEFRKIESTSRTYTWDQAAAEISKQPQIYRELLRNYPDEKFRVEVEMFGDKMSRGLWLTYLTLCHYAAYRMQLFLYLKASGRPELNTMNLWTGKDGVMPEPATA